MIAACSGVGQDQKKGATQAASRKPTRLEWKRLVTAGSAAAARFVATW